MEIIFSSFLGFLMGILSTFIVQRINELRKLSLTITVLAFEIASNQESIDLLRQVNLEKSAKEKVFFAPPSNDIYKHIREELRLLPPHILQYITRYYLLIEKMQSNWENNLSKKAYREKELLSHLSTLENYSTGIMLYNFKKIVEARNVISRLHHTRKLLSTPTWLKTGKQNLDWSRYEKLQEEIYANENEREDWDTFIAKYKKPRTKKKHNS